ncbi:DUF6328 family protein [Frondihabitans peucedani]|uniref:Sodium:proton antiporter n=1 Tax=Frondihabitans peucedani TaxID=598626 RepID=A0ABP8E590_9MICO
MDESPTRDPGSTPDRISDRDETETERLDRNWNELLQELRVTQTGTQLLTGFLLAVAFQQRFTSLDGFEVGVYLVLVALTAGATILGLAPVSLHRALFRRGLRKRMVHTASVLLDVILVLVAAAITGTVLLIFDVVAGLTAGLVAAGITAAVVVVLWLLVPRRERRA